MSVYQGRKLSEQDLSLRPAVLDERENFALPDEQKQPPITKQNLLHCISTQVMLCLVVAIILVLLHTFQPVIYRDIMATFSMHLKQTDSFSQKIEALQQRVLPQSKQNDAMIEPTALHKQKLHTQEQSLKKQESPYEELAHQMPSSEEISSKTFPASDSTFENLESFFNAQKVAQTVVPSSNIKQAGGKPEQLSIVPANATVARVDYKNQLPLPITQDIRITSPYGVRKHPVTMQADFHTGIDIAADMGTNILCPREGEVVFAGEGEKLGNYLKIKHPDGSVSIYGHCQKLLVTQGQRVSKGTILATVGSTGLSTGPHLHLAFMIDDKYVNPIYVFYNVPV